MWQSPEAEWSLHPAVHDLLPAHSPYKPREIIASGAFGTVVLADDIANSKLVALKLLPRRELEGRFAEAEVLNHAQLLHPHIITLIEVILTNAYLVLVLEYAPGGTLAGLMAPGVGLQEAQARWLFAQVMFGLEYCHRMGVAWRDIKLDNVLVFSHAGERPILKLADFGLSVHAESREPHHVVVGTPIYLAPEVCRAAFCKDKSYDPMKADTWSCGVLLYFLLTGNSPFQHENDMGLSSEDRMRALVHRILSVDFQVPSGLSSGVRSLLGGMLAKDPSQRLSAQEVLCHPWCTEGLYTSTVFLDWNAALMACSKGQRPSPEVIIEVQNILEEACSGPPTPRALASQAVAARADSGFGMTLSSNASE